MTAAFSTESIRKVFTFPFADPRAMNKLLIGLGIHFSSFIIPILPSLIVYGYLYQIMQQVIVHGEEPSLPEWRNWGKMLGDGFRLFGISFIYSLPMILLYAAGIIVYVLMIFSTVWMENASADGGAIAIVMIVIMVFFFLVIMLVTLFGFLLSFLLPMAWCQAVAKDSFRGGFEIADYWKVFKANKGGFFIVLAIMDGLFGILMMVYYILYMSIVLWCLIPFILMIGGMLTGLYSLVLWASVYREGMDKQSMPLLKA